MAASQNTFAFDGLHKLKRLAVEHVDFRASSNIQEPLLRIRRQRQIPCKRHITLDQLLDELALCREYLHPPVFPVGHIYQPVVGNANGVYDAELLRTWTFGDCAEAWRRTLVEIHWLVPECAPHAFKCARIRIEHGHAVVSVPVGDEHFVRLAIDERIRGLVQIFRVGISGAFAAVTNLHHEFAGLREFQQLVIPRRLETGQFSRGAIVSANPHEAFIVDMDAMLPLRPFIPACRPTPGLDKIALCIEHHYWRRGHGGLIGWQRPWPVQNPHTILRVDSDARRISELPLRRHLRPGGIYLEHRQTARSRRGRLSCSRCAQEPWPFHSSSDDQCHQNGTTQNFALHGVLLNGAKDLPAEFSLSNDHDSLLRLAITRPKAHSNPPTRKETRAVTSPNLDPTNTFVTASETKPAKKQLRPNSSKIWTARVY